MAANWWPIETDAAAGDQHHIAWEEGFDDEVAVDLAAFLGVGETPTNVAVKVWPITGENERGTEVTGTVVQGAPTIVGTVVSQRISGLARGAVYRGWVYTGAAGNRRGPSFVIVVAE